MTIRAWTTVMRTNPESNHEKTKKLRRLSLLLPLSPNPKKLPPNWLAMKRRATLVIAAMDDVADMAAVAR